MRPFTKTLMFCLLALFCTGCTKTAATIEPKLDQHQLTLKEQALIDREFNQVFKSQAETLAKGATNIALAVGIESDLNKGHFFMKREDLEGVVEDELDQLPLGFSAQYYLAQRRQNFPEIAVFDKNSNILVCIYKPVNGFKWAKQKPIAHYRQTEAGKNMTLTHWHPNAYRHRK